MNSAISRRALIHAGGVLAVGAALAPVELAMAMENAEARRFDFLHGKWDVTHRKLKDRLAGSNEWIEFPGTLSVAPVLGGLGNFDENVLSDPKGAYEASS